MKAGLLRAWRSGGRTGGRAALRGPRATARPRAHTRPGDARARCAPGAGRELRRGASSGRLASRSLPSSSLSRTSRLQPQLPAPLPPPPPLPAAPHPGALLARSHSTAYRLTPCMPPGPPAASRGAGQTCCQACCGAWAGASASYPQLPRLENGLKRPTS